MTEALRSATRWMAAATAIAAVAFGLLTAGQLDLATYAGLAGAVLYALAGLRIDRALADRDAEDRIDYPFPLGQRGRRLASTALVAAIGIAGFTFAAPVSVALLGDLGLILAGAGALLAPPMVVMVAIWTADGLSLRSGHEAPGDPLIGAAGALALALVLAVVTATTQFQASFVLLAAFGGLVPALFTLWSLIRLDQALDTSVPSA
jgi:hypothetical protein